MFKTIWGNQTLLQFFFILQIRTELEQNMNCNLKEFKEFIDNEMLLILGQMDKATLIFDHVYLVWSALQSLEMWKTKQYEQVQV